MEIYNSENKTLASSDSNTAPSFEKNILTKEKQKNEINRNYLPNLSEFQQIFYETKYDKGEDKALYPNVNHIIEFLDKLDFKFDKDSYVP